MPCSIYWVGQKVHLSFSKRYYRKIQTNFLANPVYNGLFSSVQFSHSVMSDPLQPHACQASLSITNSRSLFKLMSIESVMPSSHLILCHPLLLLPPIPPSIRAFSNESTLRMRWPKYWSFSFSISPSNEHPGLISFRMDWLDYSAMKNETLLFATAWMDPENIMQSERS